MAGNNRNLEGPLVQGEQSPPLVAGDGLAGANAALIAKLRMRP
jgi:hypothetical protein